MKLLLIPDKFKGSLSAEGVISAIEKGIQRAVPHAKLYSLLASDGGDGFLNAVAANVNCIEMQCDTIDPLGRKIKAEYLADFVQHTAYIELAKASGLSLLAKDEYDILQTSTYGTGIQIKHAIEQGAKKIFIGLGGSATNDAGIGIAKALGFDFLDSSGKELEPLAKNLSAVNAIKQRVPRDHRKVSFYAVNDVDNPLYGPKGAAYTYAAQKGADIVQIERLDDGLRHLAEVVKYQLGQDVALTVGAGAAGGTAYGLRAFLNAEFISGINFVLQLAQVDALLGSEKFDYIITGEGKLDEQTLHGKLIKGVVDLGKRHRIPVVAVCGQLDVDKNVLRTMGLSAVITVMDPERSVAYSMDNAAHLIEQALADFFRAKK